MRQIKFSIILFSLLIIYLPVFMVYADGLKILSLQECIDIALKRNPEILAGKQQVQKSFFKIGEARSGYFPEIELSVDAQRSYLEDRTGSEYLKQYSGQLSLTQTLFDFGRTSKKVEIQKELYKATEWQSKDIILQTVCNIKRAYFGVLKAKKQNETAQEVLRQAQKHLELARGFYEVGLKPKIEVTKAEVEVSNAKLGVITAQRQLREAFLNLKIAMGVIDMPDFDIKEEEYILRKLDEQEVLNIAIEKNPQLQAIRVNKQASIFTEKMIKREYFPTFTGLGNYGYTGEFPLQQKWSLLFQMSLPLFSGWSTAYKLKQAMADTAYYSYKEDSIKQQIKSDIKNLFIQLKEAGQKIDTLKIALKQAKENLDLAMGRYEVGVGTSIEVVDAIVLYEQTNAQYWQAFYDYNVTYAEIEKTAGLE